MKQLLDDNYDISAENWIPMKAEQAKNGFNLKTVKFQTSKGEERTVDVLVFGEDGKQIFQMKDGRFVLEDCDQTYQGDDIKYFWSENLDDLSKNKIMKEELNKPNVNNRVQIRLSEIKELKRRLREINDNEISNVDFLDDSGFPVHIEQKYIDDWAFTGLNITDFIDTNFYMEGFDNEEKI
jgi:hypothetical protein